MSHTIPHTRAAKKKIIAKINLWKKTDAYKKYYV